MTATLETGDNVRGRYAAYAELGQRDEALRELIRRHGMPDPYRSFAAALLWSDGSEHSTPRSVP